MLTWDLLVQLQGWFPSKHTHHAWVCFRKKFKFGFLGSWKTWVITLGMQMFLLNKWYLKVIANDEAAWIVARVRPEHYLAMTLYILGSMNYTNY
jgi:hypothetical protein